MNDVYPIPEFLRRQPEQPAGPRERPILFSAPMIRAILDGTKTQTRRALKVQPLDILPMKGEKAGREWIGLMQSPPEARGVMFRCKFGIPGDQLWVREAFIHEPADYCWEASVSIPVRPANTVYRADCEGDTRGAGWKPSIHMPRSASRILLEIVAVRVERLNDISADDCMAEGIQRVPVGKLITFTVPGTDVEKLGARAAYEALWNSINGPGSWDDNPYVWCLTFKRVKP